jgi:hypothetical protein
MEYARGVAPMTDRWTADIDAILADGGAGNPMHSVVWFNGVNHYGVFNHDQYDATDSTGQVVPVQRKTLLMRTGAMEPALGDVVIVDGVAYVVRYIAPEGDGRLTLYTLARQ